jgi:lipopolysaccharide export system protein LptA
MGKNYSILSYFIIIAMLSSALYEASFAEQKKNTGEPVTITSKTLTADNKAKTAVFEGAVKAVKGDMTLYADKMTVYYQDERPGSSIEKIESEGNIKVIKGERVVTSAFAQYFAGFDEKIVFTGEPRATDGGNVITGSKMTYFFNSDRYIVENSRVLLQDKESRGQKKVVR